MTTEIRYYYQDSTMSTTYIEDKKLLYKVYLVDNKTHRLDGPAVEFANGTKEYFVEGKWHRLDGPAREWPDGYNEYWINNIDVTGKIKNIKEEDIPKYLRMLSL